MKVIFRFVHDESAVFLATELILLLPPHPWLECQSDHFRTCWCVISCTWLRLQDVAPPNEETGRCRLRDQGGAVENGDGGTP